MMTYSKTVLFTAMLVCSYSANAILPDYIMCATHIHEERLKEQAESAPKSSDNKSAQDTNTATQELIKCKSTGFDIIDELKRK